MDNVINIHIVAVDEVHCSEALETVFLHRQTVQTAAFPLHLVNNAVFQELKDSMHEPSVEERCPQSDDIVVLQHPLTREKYINIYSLSFMRCSWRTLPLGGAKGSYRQRSAFPQKDEVRDVSSVGKNLFTAKKFPE